MTKWISVEDDKERAAIIYVTTRYPQESEMIAPSIVRDPEMERIFLAGYEAALVATPTLKLIDATKDVPAKGEVVLAVYNGRLIPVIFKALEDPLWVVQALEIGKRVFIKTPHWVRIPELSQFPEYKPELPKSEAKS